MSFDPWNNDSDRQRFLHGLASAKAADESEATRRLLEEQVRLQREALELEKKKLAQEQEKVKLEREQLARQQRGQQTTQRHGQQTNSPQRQVCTFCNGTGKMTAKCISCQAVGKR